MRTLATAAIIVAALFLAFPAVYLLDYVVGRMPQ